MSPEKQPEDAAGTPDPNEGTDPASGQDASAGGSGPEQVTDAQAEADAAAEAAMAQFMSGQGNAEESMTTSHASSGSAPSSPGARQPDLRTVEFSQVSDQTESGDSGSLEMLMDIRLPVSVELGRTQTFVRDILDYAPGTVVELDKLAGDPVDILVNGKLVAQGEVVVIDDHFGVRITVLLSPRDRVRSLGG